MNTGRYWRVCMYPMLFVREWSLSVCSMWCNMIQEQQQQQKNKYKKENDDTTNGFVVDLLSQTQSFLLFEIPEKMDGVKFHFFLGHTIVHDRSSSRYRTLLCYFCFFILFVWFCVPPFAVVVCRRADVAVVVSHDGFSLPVVLFRVSVWFVLSSG